MRPDVFCDPPAMLDAVGRAEWARVVPELSALGFLRPEFYQAVAVYCQVFAAAVEVDRVMARDGATDTDHWRAVFEWATELGLTPASRKSITDYLRDHGGW